LCDSQGIAAAAATGSAISFIALNGGQKEISGDMDPSLRG
jgi:hypothetical protein